LKGLNGWSRANRLSRQEVDIVKVSEAQTERKKIKIKCREYLYYEQKIRKGDRDF
jgi:hypothetical protein